MGQGMEIRYYRDLNHNYMIIDKQTDQQDGYQYHMLKTNNIEGILPCTIRRINDDLFLYYCIDSKINLSSCFEVKKMQEKELNSLLKEIHKTILQMREYLLDENEIIFNIKAIYKELTSEKTFFALYPTENAGNSFMDFAEQILMITDQEDENAISIAYKLCELTQNRELSVREIIEILLQEEKQETEPAKFCMNQENVETAKAWEEENDDIQEESEAEKEENKKDNYIFLAIFSFAVFTVLCFLRIFFNLTYRENIISLTVMSITLVLSIVSLYFEIRKKMKKSAEKSKEPDINECDSPEYNIFSKADIQFETALPQNISEEILSDTCGETIVLNPEVLQRISRLYSRNTETSIQIGFENLPITIGKMAGRVDYILEHSSISRIHARIFRNEQNQICLKDLNSTNGTFKNGIRLQPEEETIIMQGDEIIFGSMTFDYR